MISGYFQCGFATAGSQDRESISLEQFPDEKLDVNFVFYEHYDHRSRLGLTTTEPAITAWSERYRVAHRTEMRFNKLVMTTGKTWQIEQEEFFPDRFSLKKFPKIKPQHSGKSVGMIPARSPTNGFTCS